MPANPKAAEEILLGLRTELQQRNAADVRIIAVSKTHPPTAIRNLLLAGQRDFAESRQNEARDKFPLVKTDDLSVARQPVYHHIGRLQSGSARQVAGLFDYVHGVSSWSALDALLKATQQYQQNTDPHYVMRYLIQLDLTHEASKTGGMQVDEVLKKDSLPSATGFYPVGFMTMGPTNQDPVLTRQIFRECRELRDSIMPQGELSMGMSADWQIAIEEGSTMIRLGTRIFGSRNAGPWHQDNSALD